MKVLVTILTLVMLYPGKRQVLLFYNSSTTDLKNKQVALLNAQQQELRDRDIEIHMYNLSDASNELKRWNVPDTTSFQLILLGKDGGEKFRSDTVVSTQQLFAIIDAMPMRKQEMKNQK